jgi:hypothetical protein
MRARYTSERGNATLAAKEYGISMQGAWLILNRRNWTHV